MLRYLPIVVELALLVYCLIDCIQTESGAERNLNKTVWIFIIILIPIAGPVAWLVAGRPTRQHAGRSVPWPSTATAGFPEYERPAPPKGPDDDPEFLAGIARKEQAEHERLLADWEAQLREREARLRPPSDDDEGTRPADEDKRPADS